METVSATFLITWFLLGCLGRSSLILPWTASALTPVLSISLTSASVSSNWDRKRSYNLHLIQFYVFFMLFFILIYFFLL